MKSVDLFKKIKENGKINSPELDKFLEAVPDFEFPDKAFEAFEESYMTVDRAASHPSVNNKLRAELLDPIDSTIKKLFDGTLKDLVDPANMHIINSEKNTYKKLEALHAMLPKAIEKVKAAPTTDEETKKKLQTLEDTRKELLGKIDQMNTEYEEGKKKLKSEFDTQLTDYKLNGELEKLSNGYTLAEAYEKTRPAITKVLLGELRGKHSLSLAEKDGQVEIQVMDKDGKPKFNGNTPIQIKSLLDEAFEPFTKKNNNNSSGGQQQRQSQDTSQQFQVDQNQRNHRQGTRTTVQ